MAITPQDLSVIKSRVSNLYEAIIVSARKARKTNDDSRTEFNAAIGGMTTGHEDDFEERENPEQLKLSLEYEKKEKPHIQAIHELVKDGIEFRYKGEK
ncbi:MAG: DNA-directed RNA polymerase subunit omega [Melioribacteraceae bacterium]